MVTLSIAAGVYVFIAIILFLGATLEGDAAKEFNYEIERIFAWPIFFVRAVYRGLISQWKNS